MEYECPLYRREESYVKKHPGKDHAGDPGSYHVYSMFHHSGILFKGSRNDRRKLFRNPLRPDAADSERSGRIPERDILCRYESSLG